MRSVHGLLCFLVLRHQECRHVTPSGMDPKRSNGSNILMSPEVGHLWRRAKQRQGHLLTMNNSDEQYAAEITAQRSCSKRNVIAWLALEEIVPNTFTPPSTSASAKQLSPLIGFASWAERYWIPVIQRKNPRLNFQVVDTCVQIWATESTGEPEATSESTSPFNVETIRKHLATTLKKIVVEDLGYMNSEELWETIPDQDKDGRGKADMERLQKDLSVLVVRFQGHIFLVGQKQRLTKKCLPLRNILSHYHWRLSGKEVR